MRREKHNRLKNDKDCSIGNQLLKKKRKTMGSMKLKTNTAKYSQCMKKYCGCVRGKTRENMYFTNYFFITLNGVLFVLLGKSLTIKDY